MNHYYALSQHYVFSISIFALCWCNVMYIWWNEFCSWGPAAIFNQNYSFWGRTCEFRRTKADGIWTLSNFHHSEVQVIAGCASSFEKDSRGKHYRPESSILILSISARWPTLHQRCSADPPPHLSQRHYCSLGWSSTPRRERGRRWTNFSWSFFHVFFSDVDCWYKYT